MRKNYEKREQPALLVRAAQALWFETWDNYTTYRLECQENFSESEEKSLSPGAEG